MKMPSSCIGRRRWAIAEGYIPAWSTGPSPELQSHETCCMLNAGDYAGAAEQFPRRNKAGGKVLPSVVRRRAAERELFLGAA